MKIMLGTNIFISAFITNDKAQILFNKLEKLNVELYLSYELLNEINKTFKKSKLLKYINKQKNYYTVEEYIELIIEISNIVYPPKNLQITSCRDKKDNMILELASFVNADYIVTGLVFQRKYLMSKASDKDLLVLNPFVYSNKEFDIDTKVEIVGVGKFLEIVG